MNKFLPPILLRNNHLQSLFSSAKMRRPIVLSRARGLLKHSVSHILECGRGVRLQGYYSGHHHKNQGLVILIHGWEGSSDSLYLLSAGAGLWNEGFDVFRLNLRDHGPTHHLNPGLFHACRIDEIVGAVKAIQTGFASEKPIYLSGFSLGGNFALRVAARAPEAGIHLEKVVAICPVLNPEKTMYVIENGWVMYHYYFLKKWRRSLRKKREIFPDLHGLKNLSRFRTLSEMTDYFVMHHTRFATSSDYLNGYALTGDALENLRVPAHIIASADDPVIPANDLANLAKSAFLKITVPLYGGHCGFIESYRLTSWADRQLIRLFKNC